MPTPYPFQQDYLDDIERGWEEATRQLVVAPTGSGKTNLFSWITKDFVACGERVLILVDQENLVEQTAERLAAVAGLKCDVEKAERRADLGAQVVIGSVQTMYREARLSRWPQDHFGLIICDEADKSIATTWNKILKWFDEYAKVLGFTATPHRTDQRSLGVYYERLVEKENLKSLIRKGFLCPIEILMLPIQLDLTNVHTKGGDYDENELDELLRPHLVKVAEAIRDHAAFRKTVVFLPLVKTAQFFSDICNDLGLSANHISGEDPERVAKWEAFKRWDFDVMANSMLLTRGVDDPEISCVVPCRPTKSITLYFQQVGRMTRLAPGKSSALLMDFLYQAKDHLVCRPANLVAKDDLEMGQINDMLHANGMPAEVAEQLPMDLLEMADSAASQREQALRKRLEEVKANQRQKIGPEEFALMNHQMDLAEYQPVMSADSKPPTEKQMKWLKKVRVNPKTGKILLRFAPESWKPLDISQIKTVGQASKILDIAFSNEHKGPILASSQQRGLMARMGYENAENATAEDARKFFASLRKPKEGVLL